MQERKPKWYEAYRFLEKDLKLFWAKNGGKICTIAGGTGLFLSGAHACRKTYKIHDKLKKNGDHIIKTKEKYKNAKWYKKAAENAKAFLSCMVNVSKDYAPDIIGSGLSALFLRNGWKIENTNYKEATAMVGVIAGSFMNYRKNVIAEHGREADRRYLTTKHIDQKVISAKLEDGTVLESTGDVISEGEGITVSTDPSMLKILYSKETTPAIWSPTHVFRLGQLNRIQDKLDFQLRYGGHITVNDVRREFYGIKGDHCFGSIFGRVWDPGDPEHPERGAKVNLHFEDDEDFMNGLKDNVWIIIDIDDEPLIETLKKNNSHDTIDYIPGVEV